MFLDVNQCVLKEKPLPSSDQPWFIKIGSAQSQKVSACNAGDPRETPGLGRSLGFPCDSAGKKSPAVRRPGFDPGVGKIPWRRQRLPTPVFWPGELHGLYSPWVPKESDTTERLSLSPEPKAEVSITMNCEVTQATWGLRDHCCTSSHVLRAPGSQAASTVQEKINTGNVTPHPQSMQKERATSILARETAWTESLVGLVHEGARRWTQLKRLHTHTHSQKKLLIFLSLAKLLSSTFHSPTFPSKNKAAGNKLIMSLGSEVFKTFYSSQAWSLTLHRKKKMAGDTFQK